MTNKKHIRRGLAGLLAVVMLFSLVPAAFAAGMLFSKKAFAKEKGAASDCGALVLWDPDRGSI